MQIKFRKLMLKVSLTVFVKKTDISKTNVIFYS